MTYPPADALDLARCMQETCIDRVHFFDEAESTNTLALAHAAGGEAELVELFIAERQTGGRGRSGNVWWSAPGALTFSLLTRSLALPAAELPRASLTAGLAICRAIEPFVGRAEVALKWPNDVYLAGRKVCGILIEPASGASGRVVIGVGVNVNNSLRDAPESLRATATSLLDVTGASGPLDRTAVLIACLADIEQQLDRLTAGDRSLADDWRTYSLLTGRQVRVVAASREVVGRCESIADDGALEVWTAAGPQACYGGIVAEFR